MDNIKKVTVKYNGTVVGYLAEIFNNKFAFQYDKKWIDGGFSISPFSLPLDEKIHVSEGSNFEGLFGVFYDSLPDGWGELLMNRYLIKEGINPKGLTPLTKLCFVSKNGLGGLSYEPTQIKSENYNYDIEKISKEVEKILKESENADLDYLFKTGGSSSGARPKAHIKENDEDWIVKFPSSIDPIDISNNEYKANKIAKECGIDVNEFKMFTTKDNSFFGVKRFDRKGKKRIHMISLSAVLETTHRIPNLDYLFLFQVINQICVDKNDLMEAFRRMCFNVFYNNKDDHGKNFSFIYDEEKKGYMLSPFYDITKTPFKFEHEMTVNNNGNPNDEDLLIVAKKMGLPIKICEETLKDIKEKCKE